MKFATSLFVLLLGGLDKSEFKYLLQILQLVEQILQLVVQILQPEEEILQPVELYLQGMLQEFEVQLQAR